MNQVHLPIAVLALSVATADLASAQRLQQASEQAPLTPASSFWWADYDGDGFEDAFVLSPSSEGRLLRNLGDGTLEDVTELAGLGGVSAASFAAWGDVDHDGQLDLLVGGPQHATQLFRGQDGIFEDVTLASGLEAVAAVHAGFLDYDLDGRTDLHVATTAESQLYRGVGDGRFEPVAIDLASATVWFAAPKSGKTIAGATLESEAPSEASSSSLVNENGPRAASAPSDDAAPSNRQPVLSGSPGGSQTAPISANGETISKLIPGPSCARSIEDRSNPGTCLFADTTPTLGRLYPITANLFVASANGRVGVNNTNPLSRLDATSFTGLELSAVRGEGLNGPTRGYLGAQGDAAFDGVATAAWAGLEIGVGGISTGGSTSDNVGVLGHSNDVGVRGEYSGDPTGTFADLGSSTGVGITADGSSLAGDFLGAVDVAGDTTVTDGDFIVNAGVIETANLDGFDTPFGGGSQLFLNNATGITTIELDADNGGDGSSLLALRNSAGSNTVFFTNSDGGANVTFTNDALSTTIEIDGDNVSGGTIEMFNDAGLETFEIDSDSASGALMSLRNANGATRVSLDGDSGLGGTALISAADGSSTVFLDGEAENNGGAISVRHDTSSETFRVIGDAANSSSELTMWNREDNINTVLIEAQDFASTGGRVLLQGTTSGNVTAELDGSDGGVGQLVLSENDGSTAFQMFSSLFTLHNAAGTTTQSYNRITGTKSAVVDTPSYGQRLLYAMESPEVWFEDFGSGRMSNGEARIALEPIFLESVTTNEENPMKVFVTMNGPSPGFWVEKFDDSFVVHEQPGGSGNVSFDYRVVAKRRGLEGARLEALADVEAQHAASADPQVPSKPRLPQDGVDGELDRVEFAPVIPQKSDGAKAGPVKQAKPRPTAPKSTLVDPVEGVVSTAPSGQK